MKIKTAMIVRSNFWPVVAYVTGFIWLIAVNADNLGVHPPNQAVYYGILGQFDALVHYMVALALATTLAQTFGRRATLELMVFLILAWEVFEFFTQPFLANLPSITGTPAYLADTMEDIALGLVGTLTGVYFSGEEK